MNRKTITKKCLPLFGIIAFSALNAQAQTSTGIGTITPNSSAILDVSSATKGVLLPRVALKSSTDAITIAAPAQSLLVYNTSSLIAAGPGYYYNAGTPTSPLWTRLAGVDGSTAPTTGQTIIWNGTTYVAGNPTVTVAPGTPISGNGTPASPLTFNGVATGTGISGNGTTGSPIIFSGVVASAPLAGAGTTASPLTINTASPVYNANTIQGKLVSTATPTNGQVLLYSSATNQYVPSAIPGDNWGSQVAATSGVALSGNGTANAPLMVNNALPIFNANQLNSTSITGTPANGQSIIYNGTSYAPGNPSVSAGNGITGNGTPASPLAFSGAATGTGITGNGTMASPLAFSGVVSNAPLSGAGTTASPLTINTASPVFNANKIQGAAISNTTPTSGQVLLYNATTNQYVPSAVPGDNWGTQTAVTSGAAISGNGTTATPLVVNNTSPIFNANQINSTSVTGTPASGQSIVYNGTSYAPGNPSVSAGNGITGNGTPSSPLAFSGIATTGAPLSGNGTTASPLTINTASPVYNAGSIQGKAVSNTAPATNQVLVWNGTSYVPSVVNAAQIQGKNISVTGPANGQSLVWNSATNQYEPVTVASNANNGLTINGNTVQLGGALTQPTVIATSGTNTLSLQGVQTGYGNVLVLDANGVVKQLPASSTFHYSIANTAGVAISQSNQTGPVAYTQGSGPTGSIPGGGSWVAVPGLTKTISIGSSTNTVSFNCEGVTQYDGSLNTNSFVSYSIGIFLDGTLQATRSFTMVGAGSVAQFDTWQASGQMMNMSAGMHTFAVYVTRRNSNSSGNGDLYFCGAVPTSTATNTNNFMNRGVLFINGSY